MSNIRINAPRISGGSIGPSQTELWPFNINWDEQVSEKIEFRTDIYESRSGREQRRALRIKPRWSYEFATWAAAEKYQRLSQLIRGRGGQQFVIRHPVDWKALRDDATAGDTTIKFDGAPDWAQPGVHMIIDNGDLQELCRIERQSGSTVFLNGGLISNWKAGVRVRRALPARLDQSFTVEMQTNNVAAFNVNFMAEPDGTYTADPGSAAVTFDGRELFLAKPNWAQPVTLDFDFGRQTVDYGVGRVGHSLPLNVPKVIRKATYLGKSKDEVTELIQFFLRMKGQRGEFYMPTGTDDIEPTSISGGFINVAGLDLYRSMVDELTNKAVFLRKRDGTYLISKISAVTNNSGNTRIALTTSWGAVNLNTVASISLVSLWRFVSDSLSVDWLTSGVANFVLSFKALENQASE